MRILNSVVLIVAILFAVSSQAQTTSSGECEEGPFEASAWIANHVYCNGDHTGTIHSNVTQGNDGSGVNYTLSSTVLASPMETITGIFTNLAAGSYILEVVRDSDNCTAEISLTITQPEKLAVSGSPVITKPTSCDAEDGKITVQITGGTSPYDLGIGDVEIEITSSQSAEFSGLGVGSYNLSVTDDKGCEFWQVIQVTCNTESSEEAGFPGWAIAIIVVLGTALIVVVIVAAICILYNSHQGKYRDVFKDEENENSSKLAVTTGDPNQL